MVSTEESADLFANRLKAKFSFKDIRNKENWPVIWVCGESQVGKSCFLNMYLGGEREVMKVGNGITSMTTNVHIFEDPITKTVIVDT